MANDKGNRLNLYVQDYVVFDLETTGLSPETDEIIEISGIKVRGGQKVGEFTTLVNPCRPIPSAAASVNGITDGMVRDAPLLQSALAEFLAFIGEDILVGHNIHTFDTNFLCRGARRELDRAVANDYVDTLYLAKSCLPALPRHRLTDIAEYFRIETEGAHRALNDCVMNWRCYEKLGKLWEEQKRQGIPEADLPLCPKCGTMLVKRKGKFGAFLGCASFPACRYTQKV